MLLTIFPAEQRPVYLGFWASTMNLGAFIMPLVGVALADRLGFAPLLIAGGVMCLAGSATFRLRKLQTPDTVAALRAEPEPLGGFAGPRMVRQLKYACGAVVSAVTHFQNRLEGGYFTWTLVTMGWDGPRQPVAAVAAADALDQRREPDRREGRRGQATQGTGAIAARELGQGWKVSPSINLPGKTTVTLADIDGPGAIQQIWMTVHPTFWRTAGAAHLLGRRGDALGRGARSATSSATAGAQRCNVTSLPVAVNPAGGFNCYWRCHSASTPGSRSRT